MPRSILPALVSEYSKQLKKQQQRFAKQRRVLVGLPSNAPNYPDGTSIVAVAVINEFGTAKIPERSFLRKAVYSNAQKYYNMFRQAALVVLRGKDETKELQKIGMVASQDVKLQIDATLNPPNAPYTIARKGSSHPLIDTGHLRQQITYKLRSRG
jgi:hypothetical protein